ncbi:hypothetical protein ACJJTC_010846 [Scirpophaga incertulas]
MFFPNWQHQRIIGARAKRTQPNQHGVDGSAPRRVGTAEPRFNVVVSIICRDYNVIVFSVLFYVRKCVTVCCMSVPDGREGDDGRDSPASTEQLTKTRDGSFNFVTSDSGCHRQGGTTNYDIRSNYILLLLFCDAPALPVGESGSAPNAFFKHAPLLRRRETELVCENLRRSI